MLLLMMLLLIGEGEFEEAETQWRKEREASMTADTSWMNLVGLHWLDEGATRFGSDPANDMVLPVHSTVAQAGTLYLEKGVVRYEMARGQRAQKGEEVASKGTLASNETLVHNHLRLVLLERGDRLAIRIRNVRAKRVKDFKQLEFYDIDPAYAVAATYERFDEPRPITIATVIDTELEWTIPGVLKFNLNGQDIELFPTVSSAEDTHFFIMFKDQTAEAGETYGGGRFLSVPIPEGDSLTLNLNRAYNPPCAYTPWATCPLPPSDNWLPIVIEAGERLYPQGEEH